MDILAGLKQYQTRLCDIRDQAVKNLQEENYKAAISNCQHFLEIVEMMSDVYGVRSTEPVREALYCGDIILSTAMIFNLLRVAYLKDDRVLEALACFQKTRKILDRYSPPSPAQFKWLSYSAQEFATYLNELHAKLQERLKEGAEDFKLFHFLDEKLETNEEHVKSIYPNCDLENLKKIKLYYPQLFQDLNIVTADYSDGCFIATAAYSTSAHPDLDTFRNFRDEKLLTHPVGKRLVSLYYRLSPSIAQHVEKLPILKNFLRLQLGRLAQWMREQSVKC